MEFYKKSTFVTSVVDIKNKPDTNLKEVMIVGKSNVGKSSLINALTNNSKLAYTSSKPGHTRFLNYYLIDDSFYFVDCPGYGYSAKKDFDYKLYGKLVESYLNNNKNLKLIVFLLDSRHEPTSDDVDFYNFLKEYDYNFILVMTKSDKLNMSMRSKIKANLANKLGDISDKRVLLTSIENKKSISNLIDVIEKYLEV